MLLIGLIIGIVCCCISISFSGYVEKDWENNNRK